VHGSWYSPPVRGRCCACRPDRSWSWCSACCAVRRFRWGSAVRLSVRLSVRQQCQQARSFRSSSLVAANSPMRTKHILYVGVPIIPFNGQTTSNHTKLSPPLRSPLDFSVHIPLDMPNGSSRRVASGHQILYTA
jgi:hypothetical protein